MVRVRLAGLRERGAPAQRGKEADRVIHRPDPGRSRLRLHVYPRPGPGRRQDRAIDDVEAVESTARDAYERGYEQVFVEDAMTARDAGEHAHTVRVIFPRIGRVRSTADVLAALEVATRQA